MGNILSTYVILIIQRNLTEDSLRLNIMIVQMLMHYFCENRSGMWDISYRQITVLVPLHTDIYISVRNKTSFFIISFFSAVFITNKKAQLVKAI